MKGHIRKMLFVACWFVIGAGVLVLLIAAIKTRNHKTCQGYEIDIAGSGDHWFIDKKDIVQLLTGNGAYPIKGRSIQRFDLRRLEEKLEQDVWIKDAELFFDNNQVLRVSIEEREPVARVFTTSGNSFYIDSTGERLPLSEKLSARLPVFTGFPSDKPRLSSADSALLCQVRKLSAYILKEPFWMAQIAQVDITPDKRFEMIPTIGDHIIEFGDGENYDKKFGRLLAFYRKVLSKTGMNTYERIKVQYDRQVIGVRQQRMAPIWDTARSTVINLPAKEPADTEKPPIRPGTVPQRTSQPDSKNPPAKSRPYEPLSNPLKNQHEKPPVKPKAVMPKNN